MKRRIAENEFKGVAERMKLRRMWMDEKEKIAENWKGLKRNWNSSKLIKFPTK